MAEVLVVGSVAYDTISTPEGHAESALGGSANYFSLAASLYTKVNVVGVVGEDYKEEDLNLLKARHVDVTGLQIAKGKTFHWEGKYEEDMNEAITVETQLNVFDGFDPVLPSDYQNSEYVFLANIHPELQLKVLDQVKSPQMVGVDTMNLWIKTQKEQLKELLTQVDVLLLNEGEARQLAGTWNTITAVKILSDMGPKAVVVKRGEYGFLMYGENQFFVLPAFPVGRLIDPTGAGDTFAGGFFGYLSKVNQPWSLSHLKHACIHGCLLASFTVEQFGVKALEKLDWSKVEDRHNEYRRIISYEH